MLRAASALAALSTGLPAPAQTAPYPQRPIKLIVANAPGSSVDVIGRAVAAQLALALGQAMVIDNRTGAAGALGLEAGRTAPADGHTLVVGSNSSVSVAPLLQRAARYEPLRDFDLLSLLALLPNVLVCHPGLAVHSVAELIAYAKARGTRSNMASAGIGSVSHLAGVALQTAGGFQSLHVPYKGGSQGVASVVSGETDWVLTPAPAAMGLVHGGRLRLLAHSMASSSQPLGETPAIAQTLAGFEFSSWIGLMAPKGLPNAITEGLLRALAQALQQPELRKLFEANGAVPTLSTPAEFRAFLARDIELNRRAVAVAGIQAE